jgi:hypothetical protein
LPAARGRVVLGAGRAEQHLEGRDAELQHQRAVAVVGVEPVARGPEHHACRDEHRLVAGAADLEIDAVLALELDLLVVDLPRHVHRAVDAEQRLLVEPEQVGGRGRGHSAGLY